jgi:ankyrin repeat protein
MEPTHRANDAHVDPEDALRTRVAALRGELAAEAAQAPPPSDQVPAPVAPAAVDWSQADLAALIEAGRSDLLAVALAHGAPPDGPGHDAWTPLITAAAHGNALACDALLNAGASHRVSFDGTTDPDDREAFANDGWTALHWAALSSRDAPSHEAATRVLLAHGADPSAVSGYGETPLHVAAREGAVAASALLASAIIERVGAPGLNAVDSLGQTALHLASTQWPGERPGAKAVVIEDLLSLGANPNLLDSQGDAPLHRAFRTKNAAAVRALAAGGADPFVLDGHGRSAADHARHAFRTRTPELRAHVNPQSDSWSERQELAFIAAAQEVLALSEAVAAARAKAHARSAVAEPKGQTPSTSNRVRVEAHPATQAAMPAPPRARAAMRI